MSFLKLNKVLKIEGFYMLNGGGPELCQLRNVYCKATEYYEGMYQFEDSFQDEVDAGYIYLSYPEPI